MSLRILLSAFLLLPLVAHQTADHPFYTDRIAPTVLTLDQIRTSGIEKGARRRALPDIGIRFGTPVRGGVLVQSLTPGGPAKKAKIQPGDIIRSIGRTHLYDQDDVDRSIAALKVAKKVKVLIRRPAIRKDVVIRYEKGDKKHEPGFAFRKTKGSFAVTQVKRGSPAWRAGLRVGDVFRSIGKSRPQSSGHLKRLIKKRDELIIKVRRKDQKLSVMLSPTPTRKEKVLDWKGKTFKLAVVLVEFSDVKHNDRFTNKDFKRMLFSEGEYKQTPDGRRAYGSMRDYYKEVSVGQFDLEGSVFDWVRVPKTWEYYDYQDLGARDKERTSIFSDALAALAKRDGKDALDGFQGVVFIYAGELKSERGSQLWPHRSSVTIQGKRRPYYIVAEGGKDFGSIGVHCHEFGHMLGLPDFYGYGHRTGMGEFCTMAIGHLGGGTSKRDRPFHLCAYCKMKLGWLTPRVVDPRIKQHIALRPIEGSTTEALQIPLTASGDEYFLLEVRHRTGFDTDFFRDGLLIWHVGEDGQAPKAQIAVSIDLEEAHGKRYFDASLREEKAIPFPNHRTDAFTPDTFPSSASNLGSARPVYLTRMRVYRPTTSTSTDRIPAGSVFFWIGDERKPARPALTEPVQPTYPTDKPVEETDPITELPVPFTVDKDNVARPGPNIMPRKSKQKKNGKKH